MIDALHTHVLLCRFAVARIRSDTRVTPNNQRVPQLLDTLATLCETEANLAERVAECIMSGDDVNRVYWEEKRRIVHVLFTGLQSVATLTLPTDGNV